MSEPGGTTELVRRVLGLFSREGLERALEYFDEDFVGVVGPDVSAEPDTYRGHDGVRRYFAGYTGALENIRYEVTDMEEHGDSLLVAVVVSGRGVASGIEVSLPGASIWEVRDGRVARMEAFADMATAREALELQS